MGKRKTVVEMSMANYQNVGADSGSYRLDDEKNTWETPQELYNELHKEFHFSVDACANVENKKCSKMMENALDGKYWPKKGARERAANLLLCL